jgi:hypothetical protein
MRIDNEIELLEREIDLLEDVADTARRRLSGEDEEWNKRQRKTYLSMCKLIMEFKIEDPPHKAVSILGRLFTDAREVSAQPKIVAEFDKKKKTLHALMGERERIEKSRKSARESEQQQTWRNATD